MESVRWLLNVTYQLLDLGMILQNSQVAAKLRSNFCSSVCLNLSSLKCVRLQQMGYP